MTHPWLVNLIKSFGKLLPQFTSNMCCSVYYKLQNPMSFITLFLCLSLFRSYYPILSSPELRVQLSFLSYVCPSINTFLILEHPWPFSTSWMKVVINHFIWQGWKKWVVSFQTVHVYHNNYIRTTVRATEEVRDFT